MKQQEQNPAPDYYVRVTVTIAIPRNGPLARIKDETDLVLRGLSTISKDILPQGTHLQGDIITSARTVKELIRDAKRAEKRRADRGYPTPPYRDPVGLLAACAPLVQGDET